MELKTLVKYVINAVFIVFFFQTVEVIGAEDSSVGPNSAQLSGTTVKRTEVSPRGQTEAVAYSRDVRTLNALLQSLTAAGMITNLKSFSAVTAQSSPVAGSPWMSLPFEVAFHKFKVHPADVVRHITNNPLFPAQHPIHVIYGTYPQVNLPTSAPPCCTGLGQDDGDGISNGGASTGDENAVADRVLDEEARLRGASEMIEERLRDEDSLSTIRTIDLTRERRTRLQISSQVNTPVYVKLLGYPSKGLYWAVDQHESSSEVVLERSALGSLVSRPNDPSVFALIVTPKMLGRHKLNLKYGHRDFRGSSTQISGESEGAPSAEANSLFSESAEAGGDYPLQLKPRSVELEFSVVDQREGATVKGDAEVTRSSNLRS